MVHSAETRLKISSSHKGRRPTPETRIKLSKALLGNSRALGCKHSDFSATRKFGSDNSNWKGGISKNKGHWFSRQVLERDHYTCAHCGIGDPELLEVDHILPRRAFPDLIFEMRNCQVLCRNCHHKKNTSDFKKFPYKLFSGSRKGYKYTDEEKKKISECMKGKKKTLEHVSKIKLSMISYGINKRICAVV